MNHFIVFVVFEPSFCVWDTAWVKYSVLYVYMFVDQDNVEKERRIRELSLSHESDMQKIEDQLCSTRIELDSVKQESVSVPLTEQTKLHFSTHCYFM